MQLETLGILLDLRDAARFIVTIAADTSEETFVSDRLRRDAIERNLITVGEAINRLRRRDPATVARISNVEEIIGMRNVLIHQYHEVDDAVVWRTVQVNVPVLPQEVDRLLAEEQRDDVPG
jgi:uncharacterized protein with HEPN domain